MDALQRIVQKNTNADDVFTVKSAPGLHNSFHPTLVYGISRDGSRNFNIRTCELIILGQLTMGTRQAKNAPLLSIMMVSLHYLGLVL